MINRDDGGNPTVGVQNTKDLVEDDKIFAIVGHFAATVGATISYLKQNNVPMFYAANGTILMYDEMVKEAQSSQFNQFLKLMVI